MPDPASFWPKGFGRALREAIRTEQTSSGRLNLWFGTLLTILAVAAFVTGRGSFIQAVVALGLFMLACVVILYRLDQAEQRARYITGPTRVHDVQEVAPRTDPRRVRRARQRELPATSSPRRQGPKRKKKKGRRKGR